MDQANDTKIISIKYFVALAKQAVGTPKIALLHPAIRELGHDRSIGLMAKPARCESTLMLRAHQGRIDLAQVQVCPVLQKVSDFLKPVSVSFSWPGAQHKGIGGVTPGRAFRPMRQFTRNDDWLGRIDSNGPQPLRSNADANVAYGHHAQNQPDRAQRKPMSHPDPPADAQINLAPTATPTLNAPWLIAERTMRPGPCIVPASSHGT
ncbi:MAG: hypothetical protein IT562_25715 [Alphaproteobacteria bacterium]|nr:hypothetical protein [Alphaproteobacteria bacterium]